MLKFIICTLLPFGSSGKYLVIVRYNHETEMPPNLECKAKAAIASHRPVSEQTATAYRKDVERLVSERVFIRSRQSHYRLRAAWCWFHREAIRRLLAENETPFGRQIAEQIAHHLKALEAVPSGDPVTIAESRGSGSAHPLHGGLPPGLRSKKIGLGRLPSDWRLTIFHAVPDKFRDSLAVLAICGCRISELSRGVLVTWHAGGVALIIRGSKVTQHNGQPWRLIAVPLNHSWLPRLPQIDGAAIPYSILVRPNRKALQSALTNVATTCFPRHTYLISSMSFRHQFSADLKAADAPMEKLAAALGQRSVRTQAVYGYRQQGSPGGNELRAIAPLPIRKPARRAFEPQSRPPRHIVSVTKESS